MSNRKTILDDVKAWFEAITTTNGYATTVAEVRRGIHQAEDMPNRPAISFWNDRGIKTDLAGEVCQRILHLFVWGYIDIQPGVYDNLDNLVADVETCLNDSRANWDASVTEVDVKDITYYEGGASDPIGMFEMEVDIYYEYDRDAP